MDKHVQVLIYTSYLHIIGGIETFIMSFIELMSPYYDIGICCPRLPDEMVLRICQHAPLFRSPEGLSCDNLIMLRLMDDIPKGITYQKSVRMLHACRSEESWQIKKDCDTVIHVSEASKESFKSSGQVILNPVMHKDKECLILVSATRIPALDKGKNAERMLKLAKMLGDKGITFLWLNFSVTMHCYKCRLSVTGYRLREHEAAKWLAPNDLQSVKWLPADEDFIKELNPTSSASA